jgi:hypothetical protein
MPTTTPDRLRGGGGAAAGHHRGLGRGGPSPHLGGPRRSARGTPAREDHLLPHAHVTPALDNGQRSPRKLATRVSPFEEFFGYELLDHDEALGLPNGLLD